MGMLEARPQHDVFPASILPPSVAVVSLARPSGTEILHPGEERHVASAIPSRQAEFGAARWCARQALVDLGHPPVAIAAAASRAPEWPDGVVGSITHTTGCYAAAVARCEDLLGLGIDAEAGSQIDERMASVISSEAEQRQFPAHGKDRLQHLSLLFSAKESLFKMYNPITGSLLDFLDVEVELDPAVGRFEARIVQVDRPGIRGQREFCGRFVHTGMHACTAIWVDA
jgi:4'-phosphopantetheinyl transferase EntD